ncbi:N-acetyltransferase 10 [Quaeritorhiza haematococci]|nr:N-acetyltransferase 10 [Quaeritorhiza haematococci]
MGYGARCLELVEEYYRGRVVSLDENDAKPTKSKKMKTEVARVTDEDLETSTLQTEQIKVRDPSSMPPLLLRLSERPLSKSERLHWLGVSYGLTPQLHRFWKRGGYVPVYVRQTANDLTGEHTCIMLKQLQGGDESESSFSSASTGKKRTRSDADSNKNSKKARLDDGAGDEPTDDSIVRVGNDSWLDSFAWDFRRRFVQLLGYSTFRKFSPILVLSVLEAAGAGKVTRVMDGMKKATIDNQDEVHRHFSPHDLKRLESYSQNLLDYHVIFDLVPILATSYFLGLLSPSSNSLTTSTSSAPANPESLSSKGVHLSPVQAAILLGIGLQRHSIDELEPELNLPTSQIMALFAKCVKKCSGYLNEVLEKGVREEVEAATSLPSKKSKSKPKQASSAVEDSEAESDGDDDGEEDEDEGDSMDEDEDDAKQKRRDPRDEEAWDPTRQTLDDDLEEAEDEAMQKIKEKQREMINELDLSKYAIGGTDEDWSRVSLSTSSTSKIINVPNANSSKKSKAAAASSSSSSGKKKAAAEREFGVGGKGGKDDGIIDPKGLIAKAKSKGKLKKGMMRG